jgi:hypothetical protein
VFQRIVFLVTKICIVILSLFSHFYQNEKKTEQAQEKRKYNSLQNLLKGRNPSPEY